MRIAGQDIDATTPVLIAGPTASGKSAMALQIAQAQGGVIVNADALQVYDCWQVLSARPSGTELARAEHLLYGHVAYNQPYSVGTWLAEVGEILQGPARPIIIGGTGLYFRALTEGLAEIPKVPEDVRSEADQIIATQGHDALAEALDDATRARIDLQNPMRVQRAWEVLQATGKSIAAWQDETPPPLLPLSAAQGFVLNSSPEVLTPRIEKRFDLMLKGGALEEARAMEPHWDPQRPSSQAIGAPELIAYLRGDIDLEIARERAVVATRQYAKRQRTWFRARMRNWVQVDL